jgi:hypothetical protein
MVESTRQRQAFEIYWRLGAQRSVERVAAELARSKGRAPALRTLYGWSSRHQWQHRLARLEHEAQVAEDEARVAAIKEMCERQGKAGLLLQQKGIEWLVAIEAEAVSPDAAVKAIVEGAKLERLARGEPSEQLEVKSEIDARLSLIGDSELEAIIRYGQGALDGASEAEAG